MEKLSYNNVLDTNLTVVPKQLCDINPKLSTVAIDAELRLSRSNVDLLKKQAQAQVADWNETMLAGGNKGHEDSLKCAIRLAVIDAFGGFRIVGLWGDELSTNFKDYKLDFCAVASRVQVVIRDNLHRILREKQYDGSDTHAAMTSVRDGLLAGIDAEPFLSSLVGTSFKNHVLGMLGSHATWDLIAQKMRVYKADQLSAEEQVVLLEDAICDGFEGATLYDFMVDMMIDFNEEQVTMATQQAIAIIEACSPPY